MTWNDIYSALHNFVYDHTELAIWAGLVVLGIALFWMMVYSITLRRNITIILVLAAIAAWAAVQYGFIEWPPRTSGFTQARPIR